MLDENKINSQIADLRSRINQLSDDKLDAVESEIIEWADKVRNSEFEAAIKEIQIQFNTQYGTKRERDAIKRASITMQSTRNNDVTTAITEVVNMLAKLRSSDSLLERQILSALEEAAFKKNQRTLISNLLSNLQRQSEQIKSLLAKIKESPVHEANTLSKNKLSMESPDMSYTPSTDQILKECRNAFYAGEWTKAIDLAEQILQKNPNHTEAKERLQRAEEKMARGELVEANIPREVKQLFSQAVSAYRIIRSKDNFERAQKLLEQAAKKLEQVLPGGDYLPLTQLSNEVQEQLELYNNLDRANEEINNGLWNEALNKLKQIGGRLPDIDLEDKKNALQSAIKWERQINQMSINPLANIIQSAANLVQCKSILVDLQSNFPTSTRLAELEKTVNDISQRIAPELKIRGMQASVDADRIVSASDKAFKLDEAKNYLDFAVKLGVSDAQRNLDDVNNKQNRNKEVQRDIENALNIAKDSDIMNVRNAVRILASIKDSDRADKQFQDAVKNAYDAFIRNITVAVDQGDYSKARNLLNEVRLEALFQYTSNANNIVDLQNKLTKGENVKKAKIIGGLLIALAVLVAIIITRNIITPPATPNTVQPTVTMPPPPTATIVILPPTHTPSPTATPTPKGVIQHPNYYSFAPSFLVPEPPFNIDNPPRRLQRGEIITILETKVNVAGQLGPTWYKVKVQDGSVWWVAAIFVSLLP